MSRRRLQLLVIQTSGGMPVFQSVQLWTTSSESTDKAMHLTLASPFTHLHKGWPELLWMFAMCQELATLSCGRCIWLSLHHKHSATRACWTLTLIPKQRVCVQRYLWCISSNDWPSAIHAGNLRARLQLKSTRRAKLLRAHWCVSCWRKSLLVLDVQLRLAWKAEALPCKARVVEVVSISFCKGVTTIDGWGKQQVVFLLCAIHWNTWSQI